jgi:hypothetical protein
LRGRGFVEVSMSGTKEKKERRRRRRRRRGEVATL